MSAFPDFLALPSLDWWTSLLKNTEANMKTESQSNSLKVEKLQRRLDLKKKWFHSKIEHYQARMRVYIEAKSKAIEQMQKAF